ncbi:MAG: RNA polymerase sigma factor [Chitinophagales bacterium]|nr:MAG: RNA polymerase sigma factor [Chitinophagales bacterium]
MDNFEKEVIQSRPILYQQALGLLRDAEKARDIVQDTVLKALANRDRFRNGTNLRGWLYVILKNTFINQYNRQSRHPIHYSDTYSDAFQQTYQRTDWNQGVGKLKMEYIQQALDNLEEKLSVPFRMHFEGYRYEEIAEALNLPLGTVKTRIHKAREMLQKKLAELR